MAEPATLRLPQTSVHQTCHTSENSGGEMPRLNTRDGDATCDEFDDENEDVFEDAYDESPTISTIDLEQSFIDCEKAVKMFFNNDIDGAMKLMKPWSRTSLYHSLGVAIFEFIPAVLTFDPTQIRAALNAVNISIEICDKTRKHYTFVQSLGAIIKKTDYAAYSDLQAHAELCYAEALLLFAALTVLEGEDLSGLIKGTLKVRTCYNTYQNCLEIKEAKSWDTVPSKVHFNSGVQLGIATFNLMLSILPKRITSVLEFVGYSGNKYYGLSELEKSSHSVGLRSVLCDLTLLVYHLLLCPFAGGRGDMAMADALLNKALKEFPQSVWFLAFKARFEYLQGNLIGGEQIYDDAIAINGSGHNSMRKFRVLCYWELMWINGLQLRFVESAELAEKLLEESKFSKTTHTYIRAAMLMQAGGKHDRQYEDVIDDLIRQAPTFKIRIAGKSLPMEKFVVKRCARFRTQRNHLMLPALEVMCVWNLFPILANNPPVLHRIMALIDKAKDALESSPEEWMKSHAADNMALVLFMRGCVKAALALPHLAMKDFETVVNMRHDLKEDTFLVPYSVCEMATCHINLGELESAMLLLTEARKKYSGYLLESRLQFRVHARVDMIKQMKMTKTEYKTISNGHDL